MFPIFGACSTPCYRLNTQELYMHRCLQLAKLAKGKVEPNPMVGAVLVYHDRIIGEGYHQQYGQAHAEVNCISSVKPEDKQFIFKACLYVSLEPCAHFGKTPPCADLIIEKNIPEVIIGCRDPFVEVNGKGIEKLMAAGVKVITGVLENECKEFIKYFFKFQEKRRPYIILKWAQTGDGKIAYLKKERLLITNEFTNRIVHKWRSQQQSILIGTNTALSDDPELTTRLWPGNNPLRLVIDLNLRLPSHLKLFNGETKTIVFNLLKHEQGGLLSYYQVTKDVSLVHQILNALYKLNIQSVIVEGGATLLQSFIDEGAWDEARIITDEALIIGEGLPAPQLINHQYLSVEQLQTDRIVYYKNALNT